VIGFGADICRDFGRATSREWLETDGLGGYASSTIAGANTRRYHGLLIAATRPPGRRMVLLSKLEETLAIRDAEHDLSCNQYPGTIHPQGYRYLRAFRLDPFPTFLYEVGGAGAPVRLEKQVAMGRGTQAVVVRYRVLSAPGTVSLIVRPLLACREDHHLMQENPFLNTAVDLSGARDVVAMTLYEGCPAVHIRFDGAYFEGWGDWYRQFEYAQERARGLDYHEDLYSPGFFTRSMEPGETCYLIASAEPPGKLDPALMLERERRRRAFLRRGWEGASEELATLVTAADAFLVSRRPGRDDRPAEGLIAGYHWFEEWGRDTMISLPGLTLVTRQFEAARTVLRSYVSLLSQGMIPNLIPAPGEAPAYNTADATLWLFWAARKYLEYTGDREFVEGTLRPAFQEIIAWHVRGTRYGIKADSDGLLRAGEAGTQLTWMDAKVGDRVVTPRQGKPVEVNALWHHALRFVEDLDARHDGPAASEVAEAFRRRFWNEAAGYLNDVVDGESPEDASLRPNQIVAVSLPSPLLAPEQARRVVEAVQRELLTPYGLRTLSPKDPRYRGEYEGDARSRDGAYHEGTVWPWLFGPFVTAYLRVAEDKAAAQETARQWVQPFFAQLREAGLGQISEIFSGDPPHHPHGCIAQAWSVAEVLRVIVEELGGMDMREAETVELRGM
jgi:predicted glycogen debranching enzyme